MARVVPGCVGCGLLRRTESGGAAWDWVGFRSFVAAGAQGSEGAVEKFLGVGEGSTGPHDYCRDNSDQSEKITEHHKERPPYGRLQT